MEQIVCSGGAGIQIEGGLIFLSSSFLLPFSSSSSSFLLPLLHSCLKKYWGDFWGLHRFYGSRGAGAPQHPPGSATVLSSFTPQLSSLDLNHIC